MSEDPPHWLETASPDDLLALIDTVEAARDYVSEYLALDHPAEIRRKAKRLAATLARFDFTTDQPT